MNDAPMTHSYRVGDWDVDTVGCRLVRNGVATAIRSRTMSVLVYLLERATQTVTHEELLGTFWPRSSDSANPVHKCVTELRRVLGSAGSKSSYIETVPKRGYRLIAGVSLVDACIEESQETTIISIGRSAAVVKPVDGSRLSGSCRILAARIRREVIARLNRLTNATMRTHAVSSKQLKRSSLAAELGVDYEVDFDASEIDGQVHATVAVIPASNWLPSHEEYFDSSGIATERITRLVDDLAILLDATQLKQMVDWGTRDVHAYRAAVEGDLLLRSESFACTKQAADLFMRSLERDPRFAKVYCSLASAYHNMGMTAKDTPTREQLRQQLQALHRKAIQWQIDPEAISCVERQCRFIALANPFDAEAFCREEITANPSNVAAMRRYGDLLLGSKLIDESAAYLARAIVLTDQFSRDWVEQDEVNLAGARGEVERAIALMKRNLDRFPDHTMSTFGLVQTLAKHGRYAEAEFYLSRLVATDAPWGFFGRMMLMALRGDMRLGGNELAHAFADPLANNTNRGFICFVLGDVSAGVRYWSEIEPGFLPLLWQFNVLNEGFWAPGVVEDERYQALLDELGFGRRWRAYMRARVADLTPLTGIAVTTSIADQGVLANAEHQQLGRRWAPGPVDRTSSSGLGVLTSKLRHVE